MRALLVLAMAVCGLHAAAIPTIGGRLVSRDGMPVAGSVTVYRVDIRCTLIPPHNTPGMCEPAQAFHGPADAEGRFRSGPLEARRYRIAASGPGLLSSDAWGQQVVVDLREGVAVEDVRVELDRGAEVIVRFQDPQRLYFVPCASPVSCSNLIVGVRTEGGAFWGALKGPAGEDGGFEYRLLVPFDMPFRLWVYTHDYVVTDESGLVFRQEDAPVFTIRPDTCSKRFEFSLGPMR